MELIENDNLHIIFRKMKIQGNVISLSSIFKNGYEKMMLSSQFKEAGIELIDQSKEEIRAIIWETHARLNGIWKTEAGDENNQDLFRSYFPEGSTGHSLINARIGAEFLRSNLTLFDGNDLHSGRCEEN